MTILCMRSTQEYAFLVAQVEIYQSLDFVVPMSNNPSCIYGD